MKKIFLLLSLAVMLAYCDTPKPVTTSPDNSGSTTNSSNRLTTADTTRRDTIRLQQLLNEK